MPVRCQQFQHITVALYLFLLFQAFFQQGLLLRRQPLPADLLNHGLLQHDMRMYGLFDSLRVNHGDHGPPLGIDHDITLFCQTGQGVPYQCAAYAHLGGKGILAEHLPWFEDQAQYLIA